MIPEDMKPGGSGILPEDTPAKFFSRHFSAYRFIEPYIKDKKILEIGFGDGYGADFLSGLAKEVYAVDVLEKNVGLAKAKYRSSNLFFSRMDAARLEFESSSFDSVLSFQVIEHIKEENIERYLGEVHRVIKDDGVAFISTLNLASNKKPGKTYIKNEFHEKEFYLEEFRSYIKRIFKDFDIYGLFYTKKLMLFERLKKIGLFNIFPEHRNPVMRYYANITTDDFIWRKEGLDSSIDFMAVCRK